MKQIKQLTEFSNWIDSTITGVITEKQDKPDERSLERKRDITYLARQKYPDYPQAQAIELYLADKLTDFEQRDADQNRVINLQRRENEKLKSGLSSLNQELQNVEASSEKTDTEIARLKQLSGQLKTDVEQRRASTQEVNNLLNQVEQLKNKPGVTPDQYKEMRDRVEKFEKEKVNPDELKKFQGSLEQLSAKDALDKEDIAKLQNQLKDVEAKVGAQKTQDLSGISGNIQNILDRQAQIEKENSDSVARVKDLENKLSDIKDVKNLDLSKATELLGNIEQTRDQILQKQQELETQEREFQNRIEKEIAGEKARLQKYRKNVRARSKQANTKINTLLGPKVKNDIEQIQNFGKNLRSMASNAETIDKFVNDDNIDSYIKSLRGLDELGHKFKFNDMILSAGLDAQREKLKLINNKLQIYKEHDWEAVLKAMANSPTRSNPAYLLGRPDTDEKKSSTSGNDKMTEKKINEDVSKSDEYRIHSLSSDYLNLNKVKLQSYIDETSQELVLEKIYHVFHKIVNDYGFNMLFDIMNNEKMLKILEDYLEKNIQHDQVPKKNSNGYSNIIREYKKNLDKIIGEQVSKWL